MSLMFTKKRAFNHYLNENLKIPPNILQIRRNAYNNENCHLCPNHIDNHEHGNTTCKITTHIHKILTLKILSIIQSSKPKTTHWYINIWFSNNVDNLHIKPPLKNFPTEWGDIGIIPTYLKSSILNLQTEYPINTLKKIVKTTQKYMTLKWRLKFYSIYNKQLTI